MPCLAEPREMYFVFISYLRGERSDIILAFHAGLRLTNVVLGNNNVVLENNIVVRGDTMPIEYLKGRATVWPEEDGQAPQTVYFQPPKNRKYEARWLLLWQDGSDIGVSIMEQAEMEKPLTQTEYRVRDWIMGTIGIGNYVHVNQAEMARRLRIERATASRAIKRLIELQILIEGPKSGKSNTYMVNPAFCFAGGLGHGIRKRKEAIQEGKAKRIPFKEQQQGSLLDS